MARTRTYPAPKKKATPKELEEAAAKAQENARVAKDLLRVQQLDVLLDITISASNKNTQAMKQLEHITKVGRHLALMRDTAISRCIDIRELLCDTYQGHDFGDFDDAITRISDIFITVNQGLDRLWLVENDETFKTDLVAVCDTCDRLRPIYHALGGSSDALHWDCPAVMQSIMFTPYQYVSDEGDDVITRTATPAPSPYVSPMHSPRSPPDQDQDQGTKRGAVDGEEGDSESPPPLKRQATTVM
jgi:hypothetical protein